MQTQTDASPIPGVPSSRLPSESAAATGAATTPPINPDMLAFKPFSPTHGVTLLLCIALITTVVVAGRRLRGLRFVGAGVSAFGGAGVSPAAAKPRSDRELVERVHAESTTNKLLLDPAGQMLGAIGLILWLSWQFWWLSPAQFSWESSLPLHICDLGGLLASLALLTGSRTLTTLLIFWGLGLSTQAYATPVVRVGPGATEFWIFWESHTLIIGSAIYCIAVRGYRARWRWGGRGKFPCGDVGVAFALTLVYLAVMLPLDVLTGWNYGYVGNTKPEVPTLIDKLGPWPWRLFPLAALVLAAFGLVQAGFAVGSMLSRRRG